jgi:hypothetical protein
MRTHVHDLFPPPDFADTAPQREAVYLGRPDAYAPPPLRVFGCGCGKRHLQRIERTWWMRLLPAFALYQCLGCGRRVLRFRMRPQHAYSAPYPQRGARSTVRTGRP